MDEDMKQQIRICVQEEIAANTNSSTSTGNAVQSGTINQATATQNLISRTRSIIQNAACSFNVSRNSPAVNHTPNHPNRLSIVGRGKGKKRKSEDKIYTHELQVYHLLDINDDDNDDFVEDVPLPNADICIKEALIDLRASYSEDIRQKIVDICKSKLPYLQANDFKFVKRTKNRICKPIEGDGFNLDYCQIKRISGQGKINVRLTRRPTVNT